MTTRVAAWIGGGIAALCVVMQLLVSVLPRLAPQDWGYETSLLLGYPIVGAVIVARQPRNTIGWLLVVTGAALSIGLACAVIVLATLGAQPALWQRVLAWTTNTLYNGSFEGLPLALAFLFPTGRPLSGRWRVAGLAVAVIFAASFAMVAVRPGPLLGQFSNEPAMANPFGIPGVDTFIERWGGMFAPPLSAFVLVTSLWAVVARFRRARDVERLQLKWLALVLGFASVSLLVSSTLNVAAPGLAPRVVVVSDALFFIAVTLGVAVAIGIAILRHQLYDIERLINRGLVYLALSAALVLVYVGLTLLLGNTLRALSGTTSGIVTAVATLSAAALFAPLRNRIQRVVDRRFYRRKYDAARMVDDFAARLRDEVDLDSLSLGVQAVVTESMQPAHVSLWLRPTSHTPPPRHQPTQDQRPT